MFLLVLVSDRTPCCVVIPFICLFILIKGCNGKNSSGFYHLFSRKNSVLLQEEKEEESKGQRLFECESSSTAAHHYSVQSGALQENGSQAAENHLLSFTFGCIAVTPLVCSCFTGFIYNVHVFHQCRLI